MFYGSDSGKPYIIQKNSPKSFCHLGYNPPVSMEITANQDCPMLAAAVETAAICLDLFALWSFEALKSFGLLSVVFITVV